MSEMGLVSRVTPVHTAMRNCTRDEGRSFEVGNQVLISSHRKLLSSKAMVVNVAEKTEIPGLLKCPSNIRICPAQCRPQVPPHGKQKAL